VFRSRRGREADRKTGADDRAGRVGSVLGPDAAAMRIDDLPRDRQAQPGMGAEFSPAELTL
jgi:hypothetical protein